MQFYKFNFCLYFILTSYEAWHWNQLMYLQDHLPPYWELAQHIQSNQAVFMHYILWVKQHSVHPGLVHVHILVIFENNLVLAGSNDPERWVGVYQSFTLIINQDCPGLHCLFPSPSLPLPLFLSSDVSQGVVSVHICSCTIPALNSAIVAFWWSKLEYILEKLFNAAVHFCSCTHLVSWPLCFWKETGDKIPHGALFQPTFPWWCTW